MATSWEPIILSAKVFGHLSQGLYRTPAGAIKELISNSFDADADQVRIHTDFPRFAHFTCEDTGTGMSQQEFDRLMHAGIGNSQKRTDILSSATDKGRPYIGRLGLGILALAQICSQFDIISHHKASRTAFKATIKFPPYTREEIDRIAASDANQVRGGEYTVSERTFDAAKPGVRIFTEHLREAFRKRMQSLGLYGNKGKYQQNIPYDSFDQFLTVVYGASSPNQSITGLSDYEQLLFGLALAPPLPFLAERNIAVVVPSIAVRQKGIAAFNFEVKVDNITLAHPICLPSDRAKHTASDCRLSAPEPVRFDVKDGAWQSSCKTSRYLVRVLNTDETYNIYGFKFDDDVAGRRLRFGGYLFQQTGRLYPREIQGILIRINNIAIGRYDSAMLSYPLAEGPRYSMVSGEIFVEAGFEDALNIDRDSFNELHPHFIRLQMYVHGLLHELLFPETWKQEKGRNRVRRQKAVQRGEVKFVSAFNAVTGGGFKTVTIADKAKQRERSDAEQLPVKFLTTRSEIKVDRAHPLLQSVLKRSKYAPLMERIAIAFERASLERTPARRRNVFYMLLAEIAKSL